MVQNSFYLMILLFASFTQASTPGDKRTILTSGDKVYPIYYQLGQSAVLYLGLKPETVICGNKNYFNIEKLKEGLTIQPLANISTNLTVLSQDRRYLFYLTPSKNGQIDTFIDVKWIPEAEQRPIAKSGLITKESIRELGQKLNVGVLEIQLKKMVGLSITKRSIVEFTIKNNSTGVVKTSGIELMVTKANRPVEHQVYAFDSDIIKGHGMIQGRVIVTGVDLGGASLLFSYQGKSTKFLLRGGKY